MPMMAATEYRERFAAASAATVAGTGSAGGRAAKLELPTPKPKPFFGACKLAPARDFSCACARHAERGLSPLEPIVRAIATAAGLTHYTESYQKPVASAHLPG